MVVCTYAMRKDAASIDEGLSRRDGAAFPASRAAAKPPRPDGNPAHTRSAAGKPHLCGYATHGARLDANRRFRAPVAYWHDCIARGAHQLEVVRDHNHADALGTRRTQLVGDAIHVGAVKAARRLVKNQIGRPCAMPAAIASR